MKINQYDTNLYNETLEALNENNLIEDDVIWVGNKTYKMSWNEFKEIAFIYWYDAGFGYKYIELDLLVVGKDWWLERHEYDGSEWWEFKSLPSEPNTKNNSANIVIKNRDKNGNS